MDYRSVKFIGPVFQVAPQAHIAGRPFIYLVQTLYSAINESFAESICRVFFDHVDIMGDARRNTDFIFKKINISIVHLGRLLLGVQ